MNAAELTQWQSPYGDLVLERFTPDPTRSLRAWDTADELLLGTLADKNIDISSGRCLLLNDEFGALATALTRFRSEQDNELAQIESVNDSSIGIRATRANLEANSLASYLSGNLTLESRIKPDGDDFDVVLIKVPKSLTLMEDQLYRLRSRISSTAIVLSAAMTKHLPPTVQKLLERVLGPTTRTLAVRKARVLITQQALSRDPGPNPYPIYQALPDLSLPLLTRAGVFSIKRPDPGSMLLAQNIPEPSGERSILDLGCGAGLLGLLAASRNPEATIVFVDDSHAAIESAKENWQTHYPSRPAIFCQQDCLEPRPPEPVDQILCNPPFHEKFHLSTLTAERMFRQSREILPSGGTLLVVGNRHLSWEPSLKRLFGDCKLVAQNKKFLVHLVRKR